MKISDYLKEQAKLHPGMEPIDAVKFCYQAAYGAEHLLKDAEAARVYFQEEYSDVEEESDGELLYESISNGSCRVNLRAWKRRGLPGEWLFHMFVRSTVLSMNSGQCLEQEKKNTFMEYLKEVGLLCEEGIFGFDRYQWKECLKEYPLDQPVAVHHSQSYREKEKPAYRVVSRYFLKQFGVLEALAKLPKDTVKVLAIEGKCGSGKTVLAKELAEIVGAGVVHMDDFFLPGELRTTERLEEAGGNIHYERFAEEVLPKLRNEEAFSYRRFDCGEMALRGERQVERNLLRIVEGSYSCHPKFGEYMDIRVFLDVDEEEQRRRLTERDGEAAMRKFENIWIPMEKRYFETFDILGKADIVVFNQDL